MTRDKRIKLPPLERKNLGDFYKNRHNISLFGVLPYIADW